MKKENMIEKMWYNKVKQWDKLSQKHANSKESEIKGYVTNQEHITGEKLSFIEGWIHALEWVLDMTSEKLIKLKKDLKNSYRKIIISNHNFKNSAFIKGVCGVNEMKNKRIDELLINL